MQCTVVFACGPKQQILYERFPKWCVPLLADPAQILYLMSITNMMMDTVQQLLLKGYKQIIFPLIET